MKQAKKAMAIFNRATGFTALLGMFLVIFLMLGVSTEVVFRYFLGHSIIWMPEVSEYSLLFICFLGAAWVLKRGRHAKMDLVLSLLNPRAQALTNTINYILGAIICLLLTWHGAVATLEYFQLHYFADTPLQPPKFIIVAIIPVGIFLLFIQFLRGAYGYWVSWRALGRQEEGHKVINEAML